MVQATLATAVRDCVLVYCRTRETGKAVSGASVTLRLPDGTYRLSLLEPAEGTLLETRRYVSKGIGQEGRLAPAGFCSASGHVCGLVPTQQGIHMVQVSDLDQPGFQFLQFLFSSCHASSVLRLLELCLDFISSLAEAGQPVAFLRDHGCGRLVREVAREQFLQASDLRLRLSQLLLQPGLLSGTVHCTGQRDVNLHRPHHQRGDGDQPALAPRVAFYQRLTARDQDEAAGVADGNPGSRRRLSGRAYASPAR